MHWSTVNTFTYALVALLVVVDPPGTAAVFAAMTPNDTVAERASRARRAWLIAFLVLAAFGIAGLVHAWDTTALTRGSLDCWLWAKHSPK